MTAHHNYQAGDIILDNYLPDAAPDERKEARERLDAFVEWQMRIIIRQLNEEADSRGRHQHATIGSAQPPS